MCWVKYDLVEDESMSQFRENLFLSGVIPVSSPSRFFFFPPISDHMVSVMSDDGWLKTSALWMFYLSFSQAKGK